MFKSHNRDSICPQSISSLLLPLLVCKSLEFFIFKKYNKSARVKRNHSFQLQSAAEGISRIFPSSPLCVIKPTTSHCVAFYWIPFTFFGQSRQSHPRYCACTCVCMCVWRKKKGRKRERGQCGLWLMWHHHQSRSHLNEISFQFLSNASLLSAFVLWCNVSEVHSKTTTAVRRRFFWWRCDEKVWWRICLWVE